MFDWKELLDFWFGELDENGIPDRDHRNRWFRSDRAFDQEIRRRFLSLVLFASEQGLDHWRKAAGGSLAEIILLDQFTRDGMNKMPPPWGGSLENRLRFPLLVAQSVADAIGPGRVGYRISPLSDHHDAVDSDPGTTFSALATALGEMGLAYLHAVETWDRSSMDTRVETVIPRIAKAYLIGEAAPGFSATLGEAVPYEISGTLDAAVRHAAADAAADDHPEPVVLLSPACASFDQYKNFEVRGDAFKAAVAAIEGIRPIGGTR